MLALILSCLLIGGTQLSNISANDGDDFVIAEEKGEGDENKDSLSDGENQDGEEITGSCGKNAAWTYKDGVLLIDGSGEMSSEILSGSSIPWADEAESVTKLIISDEITKIGGFSNLTSLEKVVFGKNVKTVSKRAFYGCSLLLSCDLSDKITTLESEAFYGCESLISVTIPASLSEIGDKAFLGCSSLNSVMIPESVKSIGSYAFGYSKASESGKKDGFIITGYSDSAASKYASEHNITFASLSVKDNPSGTCGNGIKWEIKNGVLYISGKGDITSYASASKTPWSDGTKNAQITRIELSNGITGIGNYAFAGIRNVDTIVIPNTLTKIGNYAFSGSSIKIVSIPSSVKTISKGAFAECKGLIEVTLGSGLTAIGESAFEGCTSLEKITIPGKVKTIGSKAFKKCTALDTVKLSDGISEIGTEAFYECSKLKTVSFPKTLKTVGIRAFSSCKSLASVKLPPSVEQVLDQAFSDCTALKTVDFENGVKKLGAYAFSGCSALSKIRIPDSVTLMANGVFLNCSTLSEAAIGSGIKDINARMFENCIALKSVSLPENLKTIGERAFVNCRSLLSITIPQSVTGISAHSVGYTLTTESGKETYTPITGFTISGIHPSTAETYSDSNGFKFVSDGSLNELSGTFGKNGSLKWSLKVESGTFRISGEGAIPNFKENEETPWTEYKQIIKSIIIDRGITEIGSYAFYGCESITSVSFPTTLVSIGSHAFDGCSSIETAEFPSSLKSIGDYAFYACIGLETARMPDGLLTIGERAFFDCTHLSSITVGKSIESIGTYAIGYFGENPTKNREFVIYGGDNSVAKSYASSNGLSFANSDSLEYIDPETRVTISFANPETDCEINIKRVKDEDKADYVMTAPQEKTDIFIASLIKQGEVIAPKGKVYISAPVPEGANPDKCNVYRICGSGSFELLSSTFDSGMIKFEAPEMFDFIITEADLSEIYIAKINYIYENGATVADPVSVFCTAGAEFELPSPQIDGFTASNETLKVTVGSSDIDYTVTYAHTSDQKGAAELKGNEDGSEKKPGYTVILIIELIVLVSALAATAVIIFIYLKRKKATAEGISESTVVIDKTDMSQDLPFSGDTVQTEQDVDFDDDLVFDETQFDGDPASFDDDEEEVFDESILAIIEKEEDEDSDMKIAPDKSAASSDTIVNISTDTNTKGL